MPTWSLVNGDVTKLVRDTNRVTTLRIERKSYMISLPPLPWTRAWNQPLMLTRAREGKKKKFVCSESQGFPKIVCTNQTADLIVVL